MDNARMLSELEEKVIEMLLTGDHPVLAVLRTQFERCKVVKREFTRVGFFTHFEVPADVARVESRSSFELGDVHADIPGLELGADFLLFVREGAIDFLEGFTYGDDCWPETITTFTLQYIRARDGVVTGYSADRDWETLYPLLRSQSEGRPRRD